MGRRPRRAGADGVHDADGADLVMDRVDGRAALEGLETHPWRVPAIGRLLADLHHRLDAVPVAEWMPQRSDIGGDVRPGVVHCDLHPLNVMVTADGPVLIDWTRSGCGDRRLDLAHTWLIVAELGLPTNRAERAVQVAARRAMLAASCAASTATGRAPGSARSPPTASATRTRRPTR